MRRPQNTVMYQNTMAVTGWQVHVFVSWAAACRCGAVRCMGVAVSSIRVCSFSRARFSMRDT